jgi:hypothetical protein
MKCRVSGKSDLIEILDLGVQSYTGIFPSFTSPDAVPSGELRLGISESSGLVQLMDRFDANNLYGENYGYRTGLNKTMVSHLQQIYRKLYRQFAPNDPFLIIDIGSNDGTLLNYALSLNPDITAIGVDPSSKKFAQYYSPSINLEVDFFSYNTVEKHLSSRKASIVTSIAMFYDLDDPVSFARDIHKTLADDGVWHFEQSYLPKMLSTLSFDTICHEHYEYYTLTTIKDILDMAQLRIIDITFNDTNGGSIGITCCKQSSKLSSIKCDDLASWFINKEHSMKYKSLDAFVDFVYKVKVFRQEFSDLISKLSLKGDVCAVGASTKGNVLLQYCNITPRNVRAIGEVNPYKFGRCTPGTHIPIIPETDLLNSKPDYLIVLPWHFRYNMLDRFRDYCIDGGRLIFPLPSIEVV